MRTLAERVADVRRVVIAGNAVKRDRARLVPEIARVTGLSPEGVTLGLLRHLETDAALDDLVALVARAGHANAVHVILSANVFVAPLRAVAIALAASERVAVRPSRRDPVFARALVEALADPRVTLVDDLAEIEDGEVHVYGRDATIASVRSNASAGVLVRGHGAGMGVAIVTASAHVEDAARLVADDVVPFDQRGCLSPRVVLVEGGAIRARAFCEALSSALGDLGERVPRGKLDDTERAEAVRYADTIAFAGDVWRGAAHLVGMGPSLVVPPAGRHVHVVPIAALADAPAALAGHGRFVVAMGSDDLARVSPHAPRHARLSALGAMQRPPLDGPVDLRVDTG